MGQGKANAFVLQSASVMGVVGSVVFCLVLVVLTVLRPDLDPGRRYVSEFARGPYGWLMTASFVLLGTGLLVVAEGLYRATPGAKGRSTGTALLALSGCGLVLMGLFPSDLQGGQHTTSGFVHASAAVVTFLCLLASFFAYARTFRLHEDWRALHPWATGLAAACAVAVLSFFSLVVLTHPLESDLPNRLQGAGQRMAIFWSMAWVALSAGRLRRLAVPRCQARAALCADS